MISYVRESYKIFIVFNPNIGIELEGYKLKVVHQASPEYSFIL